LGFLDPSGVPDTRAGVDVKQPLRGPPPGAGEPIRSFGGVPSRIREVRRPARSWRPPGPQPWDPGDPLPQGREPGYPGIRRPRDPGAPGAHARTRPPARGLFYINPSRRSPVPGRSGVPSGTQIQDPVPGLPDLLPAGRGPRTPFSRNPVAGPRRGWPVPKGRGGGPEGVERGSPSRRGGSRPLALACSSVPTRVF